MQGTRVFPIIMAALVVFGIGVSHVGAQEAGLLKLPEPRKEGGKPLMQVLQERQTNREFSAQELPEQLLSDLLWAAFGINRPESGKRTAPSAMNMQEIDIYVAKSDGLYLYMPLSHSLKLIVPLDLRGSTGKQEFVQDAALNLVYVADYERMERVQKEEREVHAAYDTGYISQNVYLFCTSEGLATVARGWVDKPMLSEAMKLKDSQKIMIAQTVGYPAE